MDLLDRLLGHDRWTTEQLLARCRELRAEQWTQPFDLGHQTLDATFRHMIGNVRIWTDLMAERSVPQGSEQPAATVDDVITQWQTVYSDFATLARGIADQSRWDATYVDVLDDPPRRKTFGGTIAHVITHNMHHRAEVIHILTRLGLVNVLEGDLLSWEQRAPDSITSDVRLRDVTEADLPIFFEQQLDPDATQMAAFPARDWEAFMAHWTKILGDATIIKRTILVDGQVAGNIVSWEQFGERNVGYWLGRNYWGRGVATRALAAFLEQVKTRPLYAHVAKHNRASIRVLEKCGFAIYAKDQGLSNAHSEEVEECILRLESDK